MIRQTIREIHDQAEAFLQNPANADLRDSMTPAEVRLLIALGAATGRRSTGAVPPGAEAFRAAIEGFSRPFTAAELADAVAGSGNWHRPYLFEASAAAKAILGREPRKSNGRQVFDPPARWFRAKTDPCRLP